MRALILFFTFFLITLSAAEKSKTQKPQKELVAASVDIGIGVYPRGYYYGYPYCGGWGYPSCYYYYPYGYPYGGYYGGRPYGWGHRGYYYRHGGYYRGGGRHR